MENTNGKADSNNTGAEENPNNHSNPSNDNGGDAAVDRPRRTPFSDLSQVDADLALARTLQEQERAYMMLTMRGNGGSDYDDFDEDDYDDFDGDDYDDFDEDDYDASDVDNGEGDASDEHAHAHAHAHAEGEEDEDEDENVELDPSAFPDDEAYARALQEAEELDIAARLLALAGINERITLESEDEEDEEDHGGNSQDAWEDVDPDELSYEELLALGEVVGTESRGLSAETIASLPSINYKSQGSQEGISDSCVICRLDYEDDETLTILSCKHSYHSECINNWLHINKVCPVCSAEVSTTSRSS